MLIKWKLSKNFKKGLISFFSQFSNMAFSTLTLFSSIISSQYLKNSHMSRPFQCLLVFQTITTIWIMLKYVGQACYCLQVSNNGASKLFTIFSHLLIHLVYVKLRAFISDSPIPFLLSSQQTLVYSDFIHLTILDTSCKWNYAVFVFE